MEVFKGFENTEKLRESGKCQKGRAERQEIRWARQSLTVLARCGISRWASPRRCGCGSRAGSWWGVEAGGGRSGLPDGDETDGGRLAFAGLSAGPRRVTDSPLHAAAVARSFPAFSMDYSMWIKTIFFNQFSLSIILIMIILYFRSI